MYFLTYLSETSSLRDIDISNILKSSRKNNAKVEVTGLLLMRDDFVFQLLEGNKDNVIKTFKRISQDPRHTSINVLFEVEEPGADRIFPKWQMGFINGKLEDHQQKWLSEELLEITKKDQNSREKVLELLRAFSKKTAESAADVLAKSGS